MTDQTLTAHLIRTRNTDLDTRGRWAETLVLPYLHGDGVAVYTRTTNGAKGRGNSWPTEPATSAEVLVDLEDHAVVGTVTLDLSPAESRDLAENGWSRALATRISHERLTIVTDSPDDLLSRTVAETYDQVVATQAPEPDPEPEPEPEVPASPASPFEPISEEALLALHAVSVGVPSGEAVEGYVGREIVSAAGHVLTDFQTFDVATEENLNVLLVGDTGSGKTTGVRAWARHHGRPCYVVPGNGPLDPPSLFGRYSPDPKTGSFSWVDGPVTTLLRHGGVLVLDEINMIGPKVLSVLYPLLDGRREIPLLDHNGEVVRAHKDLQIFATMNEGIGYAGTAPLSHAVKNRFIILRWGYDPAVEKNLIAAEAVRTFGDRIRDLYRKGDVETPTTTNSLMVFERLAKKTGSVDLAAEVFLNRYTEGVERDGVKVAFEALRANIEDDLGLSPKKEPNVNPAFRRTTAPSADDYVITIN